MGVLKQPELRFFEEDAVSHIVKNFDSKGCLIVSCPHYEKSLENGLLNAKYVVFDTPEATAVEHLLKSEILKNAHTVIGLGGGVSTDVAKALGVNKNLYVYPTILSTNCLSNNRSVLSKDGDSFSFPSGNPIETIICLSDLMNTSRGHRVYWTQAGYGDFIAELSAAIERELLKSGNVQNFSHVIQHDPEVWEFIEWIANSDPKLLFEKNFMIEFAKILHSTSAKVLSAGTNSDRIGSEHDLYKALLKVDPSLRFSGAPHGTITGLGTLIVTKVYEKVTLNNAPYQILRKSLEKMEFPLSYSQLEQMKLTKPKLQSALKLLKLDPDADRFLKRYIDSNGDSFLDEIF